MHKSTGNFKQFKKLTSEMDRAPNNLQKILTHLSIRQGGEDDTVTYQDLDFEDFDDAEMEAIAPVEYTPIDLDRLQGDLGGLLDALKVHL